MCVTLLRTYHQFSNSKVERSIKMSQEIIDNMLDFSFETFPAEVMISLLVMLIIIILSFVVYFKFRKADPLKKNGSFVEVVALLIEKVQDFTVGLMGKKWIDFSGYALGLGSYIILGFLVGLTGLPGPFTYLGVTLSIGLCTFLLIHITAIKANKWKYFQRYIDPLPMFLPVNLLSMWAPLLSLSLRLFGNALAGFTLMTIVYYFLGMASDAIFSLFIPGAWPSIILPPFITPVLHAYFDVFSGAIQCLIFVMLTMIFVSQEDPDEGEDPQKELKSGVEPISKVLN